jgi:hypothetical protein
MTPKQTALYWREWAACRRALIALGHQGDDTQRRALQRNALGERTISSKALTNDQFDAVLAKFRSYSQPDDLDAQLRQIDQPEQRAADLRERIASLSERCGIDGGATGLERYFAHWFRGQTYASLDPRALQQLAGLLERRAKQLPDDEAPF